MNAVVHLDPHAAKLDAIVVEVATTATDMVKGAHRIGTLLNEAKASFDGDDKAWGNWRSANIVEQLGITKRTAQRMMQLAEKFPGEKNIPNASLSVLYVLCAGSTEPSAQEEILNTLEDRNGKMTHAEAERIAAQHRRRRLDLATGARRAGVERINGQGQEAVARDFDQADRELDMQDQGQIEAPRGPIAPRREGLAAAGNNEPQRDAEEVQVDAFLRMARAKSPRKRALMMAYLLAEMKTSGLMEVADDCKATFTPNGRTGKVEVTC